jgi:hypothetical protein
MDQYHDDGVTTITTPAIKPVAYLRLPGPMGDRVEPPPFWSQPKPPTPLTDDEQQVLRFLEERPGATAERIARALDWDGQRVYDTLNRLMIRGKVLRAVGGFYPRERPTYWGRVIRGDQDDGGTSVPTFRG